VQDLAHGADGGGHKHAILARAIAASGLPPERIVYIGDNVNDVEAGLCNGVHFIGFSTSPERRASSPPPVPATAAPATPKHCR
jgi:phosphoglycolate phosphatase-like HAD superfamily hydrolase